MKKRVCFIVLSGVLTASSLLAATRTWLSSSGGLWTNTLNWSEATLPSANDIADLSAATGTLDLTEDVTVGEILYNPTPVGSTTNVLAILSDTVAPASRTVTLITTLTNHLQVGEGAELQVNADVLSNGNLLKDGYGTLVIKGRLYATYSAEQYQYWIEQGRVINEGTIIAPSFRMSLGTVEPEVGEPAELVLREGSSYLTSSSATHSDVWWGYNRLGEAGTGARGIVTHEGGVLNLTTNYTNGAFINGGVAEGNSVYNLSGGEVNLSGKNKKTYIGFNGTGVVNQTGGKLTATELIFTSSASGTGIYNLTGGELWLGGIARNGSGTANFNIGGAAVYPVGSGFNIYDNTKPSLTGVNGLTRFCSTGSDFINSVSGLSGPGGFVKEGADTLNIAGSAHSFTGPIIISNGTVNVSTTMSGRNDVLIVDGTLNLNAGVSVLFSSLMVTGGVFQVSPDSIFSVSSVDPWLRVAGSGTAQLLDGSKLLRLDVSESGVIDLSAGGTASVYRVRINGIELAPGLYSSANCSAIAGSGSLAVLMQWEGAGLVDTFSRTDSTPAFDSLGQTEVGDADWAEFPVGTEIGNFASIVNNELRLGVGNSDPGMALTAAYWPNGVFTTRMRFKRVGGSGATVKNACGLLLRRSITIRKWMALPGWDGAVHVLMTPAGGLFLRAGYNDNKYIRNPFTGSEDYMTYGAPGSLPTSINGLPFDANGDGRLGDDEPFELTAVLSGSRLQVQINGEPVMAYNGFAVPSASAENSAGLWKNRLAGGNVETHDSYHDSFTVTNLPYLIRHTGSFDPNVDAASPLENWILNGDTNLVSVGPVTEMIGGEEVQAWSINDTSTSKLVFYKVDLTTSECDDLNTNRWRFTMRLRVVNDNSAMTGSVAGQVATGSKLTSVSYGSDAAGNAQVKVSNGATHTIPGGNMYHTYALEHDPKTVTLSLACDGVPLESGIAWGSHTLRRILWGANSSAGLGHAHYQLVQFELLPPLPPPPPGTLMLLR